MRCCWAAGKPCVFVTWSKKSLTLFSKTGTSLGATKLKTFMAPLYPTQRSQFWPPTLTIPCELPMG